MRAALVTPNVSFMSILLMVCFATSIAFQTGLKYLGGVQRLNGTNYMDYYFRCSVVGIFFRWSYNDNPLTGFGIGIPGRVIMDTRLEFEYTATLLLSEQNKSNEANFISMLVVSFNGSHPDSFNVTCNSLKDSMKVTANQTSVVKSSNNSEGLVLDHVLSTQEGGGMNTTHVFVCGVPSLFQFLRVDGPAIGFTSSDKIGQDRTLLSQDSKIVDLQGVLIARQPSQSIALFFVIQRGDITVTCYDNSHQVQISSNAVPVTTGLTTSMTEDITDGDTTDLTSRNIDATTVTSENEDIYHVFILLLLPIIFSAAFAYFWHRKRTKKGMYNVQRKEEQMWEELQLRMKVSIVRQKTVEQSISKESTAVGIEEPISVIEKNVQEFTLPENRVVQPDSTQSSWTICPCPSLNRSHSKKQPSRAMTVSEEMQPCREDDVNPIFTKSNDVLPFSTRCGEEECELPRQLKSETQSGDVFAKNYLSVGAKFAAGRYFRKSRIIEHADGYIMEKNSGTSNIKSFNLVPGIDNELSQNKEKSHLDSEISKNSLVRIVELKEKDNFSPIQLMIFSAFFILLSYLLVIFVLTLAQQLRFRGFPLCSFIYREQFSYIFHADANWLSWLSVQVGYWSNLLVGKTVVIFLEECLVTEQRTRIWQKNVFFFSFCIIHCFVFLISFLQLVHGRIRTALYLLKCVLARNLPST